MSAVYSTLSRRNAKAQTDALALSADVAEQVGIARTFIYYPCPYLYLYLYP